MRQFPAIGLWTALILLANPSKAGNDPPPSDEALDRVCDAQRIADKAQAKFYTAYAAAYAEAAGKMEALVKAAVRSGDDEEASRLQSRFEALEFQLDKLDGGGRVASHRIAELNPRLILIRAKLKTVKDAHEIETLKQSESEYATRIQLYTSEPWLAQPQTLPLPANPKAKAIEDALNKELADAGALLRRTNAAPRSAAAGALEKWMLATERADHSEAGHQLADFIAYQADLIDGKGRSVKRQTPTLEKEIKHAEDDRRAAIRAGDAARVQSAEAQIADIKELLARLKARGIGLPPSACPADCMEAQWLVTRLCSSLGPMDAPTEQTLQPHQFNCPGDWKRKDGAIEFRNNGDATLRVPLPAAGRYVVYIQAAEQHAGTDNAHLRVSLANANAQHDVTARDGQGWNLFRDDLMVDQEGDAMLTLSYTNDAWIEKAPKGQQDRNLVIGAVGVAGPYALPSPPAMPSVADQTAQQSIPGRELACDTYWNAWDKKSQSGGWVEGETAIIGNVAARRSLRLKPGCYVFQVHARQNASGPQDAHMLFALGSRVLGQTTVSNKSTFDPFNFSGTIDAETDIDIAIGLTNSFWGDGKGRQLVIERIDVFGPFAPNIETREK